MAAVAASFTLCILAPTRRLLRKGGENTQSHALLALVSTTAWGLPSSEQPTNGGLQP